MIDKYMLMSLNSQTLAQENDWYDKLAVNGSIENLSIYVFR